MKVLTNTQYYGQIANVIREQNGTNNTYKPAQMVSALKDLLYEEMEGVPPISFQGIGENLLDYRIDGASGGVGEKTSNLFNCELENKTMNWETGKTNANSTNRITTTFFHLTSGTYFLNADILEEATIFHYSVDEIYKSASQWYTLPAVFTIDEDEKIKICFRKKDLSGTPISENYNIIVREGSTATDYEPFGYKVPIKINNSNVATIYLDSPIYENERISLSDTNVNIPTVRGTNILTVDTTVQPSKVYVKVRKESQYETIMRERYEEAQAQLDALESGGE